jgi:hypothetical protein
MYLAHRRPFAYRHGMGAFRSLLSANDSYLYESHAAAIYIETISTNLVLSLIDLILYPLFIRLLPVLAL